MEIKRVGVIGCGIMGSGIAEVCARAGLDVVVREVDPPTVEAGRRRIHASLDRALRADKIGGEAYEAALAAIRFTTDMGELADRQLVIEAVVEREDEKVEVFSALDKVVTDPTAVLASNTSSIPIMRRGRRGQSS